MKRSIRNLVLLTAVTAATNVLAQSQPPASSSTADILNDMARVPSTEPILPATTAPAASMPAMSNPFAPPSFAANRWDENYTYLSNPTKHTDIWDPIKYIPLGPGPDWYLSLGGQWRERYEYFNNNLFGAGAQTHGGYFLTRLLTDVDVHFGPNVRVFGQIKDSFENGREGGFRPTDVDQFNVQQLFADVNLPFGAKDDLLLRFGRQDLAYGSERLISPLDWSNNRRTFEGFKSSLTTGDNKVDLFWVRPTVIEPYHFDEGNGRSSFEGVYDTVSLNNMLPKSNSTLDVYGLGLNQSELVVNKIKRHVDTYTAGVRLAGKPGNWNYDLEGDYQFGRVGEANIDAYSASLLGGYTCKEEAWQPHLDLGFDVASGDHSATDPTKQTFNQLFPLGHKYFGAIDVIGRQNIIDLHPEFTCTPCKNITAHAEYHVFWRADSHDSVYDAGGNVLRATAPDRSKLIGNEFDFLLNWQIDRHLSSYVGYSHFFAGSFLQQTGANKDIDFAYAALTYTF